MYSYFLIINHLLRTWIDQELLDDRTWGKGFRALVIRNYHASIKNVEYNAPSIKFIGLKKWPVGNKANLLLELTAPKGIDLFLAGDNVTFDVEIVTLPKNSDYYGSNESLRSYLLQCTDSWKLIHREAKGNDLCIEVIGGNLKNKYPIIIHVTNESEVQVNIEKGGVGAIPIQFEALPTRDYVLKQVNNSGAERYIDFWQTEFDEKNLFTMTFNVISDDEALKSSWLLQKVSEQSCI